MAARGRKARKSGRGGKVLAVVVIVVAALIIGVYSTRPQLDLGSGSGTGFLNAEKPVDEELPTPIIAQCKGVDLHSAVRASQLTEILIHNASFDYAFSLSTRLEEATNTTVMKNHGTGRDAADQPTGDEWLTGQFIRCYRSDSAGPRLSAIDCGGPVGATVYSPVTGTVVKVKKYSLYGQSDYPDVQIHIQPDGHPEMDVVLIHLQDVSCKEGDAVFAGVTPLATVRDVYAYIGDSMQLRNYTAKGDNGNHTHIQVNNVKDKDYHGLD